MKECAGDVSAARPCLGDIGSVRVTYVRKWQVGLREDRGVMEFMPAKLLACSMPGHVGGEFRDAVAEMHATLGKTRFEAEQSRHFVPFAFRIDQHRTQHHVTAALDVNGSCLRERFE